MSAQTSPPARGMGQREFIALTAMMFATVAFSTDAMLPAFSDIAAELTPDAPNGAQLVLTSFVLGMGVGTFVAGPLSDAFGRKRVMTFGAMLYCISAVAAWAASSLEWLLMARLCQGLGASGPRVVMLAVVRDLYVGREMTRIMSFAMVIFVLFPAIAPLVGEGIMALSGWRAIFVAFLIFSMLSWTWMQVRLPESLPPDKRRAFRLPLLWSALGELLAHRVVRISLLVQGLAFGMIFTMLSLVQPVFDETFGKAESFAVWFGAVAIVSGSASLLNARIVMRLGMRRVVTVTFAGQVVCASTMILIILAPPPPAIYFAAFMFWMTTVFFQVGLTAGNINAMAMEPVGHIAGTAASLLGGLGTVFGVALAIPVGQLFSGSPMPLAIAVCLESALAVCLMTYLTRLEHGDRIKT